MNIFCLLTGRGNNTLANKNILPVLGRPLLTYPASAARAVVANENLYASSDDEEILHAAETYNFKAIKRPKEISGPKSLHIDAITHAVNFIEKERSCKIEILVVMLANSATIKSQWIKDAIGQIESDRSISAIVPAYIEQDHHPFRAKKMAPDGTLIPYFDFGEEHISTNRQDLSTNYFLCHNFWVLNVAESLDKMDGHKPWVFLGKRVKPIVVEDCFDVHTLEDIERTERWLTYNNM